MTAQLVVQQLVETQTGLYAVSKDGAVWVYQGNKYGWSKLNMTAMTTQALQDKRSSRTSSVPAGFHDESDRPF